jgi:hypothetical protein
MNVTCCGPVSHIALPVEVKQNSARSMAKRNGEQIHDQEFRFNSRGIEVEIRPNGADTLSGATNGRSRRRWRRPGKAFREVLYPGN